MFLKKTPFSVFRSLAAPVRQVGNSNASSSGSQSPTIVLSFRDVGDLVQKSQVASAELNGHLPFPIGNASSSIAVLVYGSGLIATGHANQKWLLTFGHGVHKDSFQICLYYDSIYIYIYTRTNRPIPAGRDLLPNTSDFWIGIELDLTESCKIIIATEIRCD